VRFFFAPSADGGHDRDKPCHYYTPSNTGSTGAPLAEGMTEASPVHEEKGQSKGCLGLALFASVLEETGNEIGVKSSSLALHLSDIWPDCGD
jgi:hypothetical protein